MHGRWSPSRDLGEAAGVPALQTASHGDVCCRIKFILFLRSLLFPPPLILLSYLLRITTLTSAFVTGFLWYSSCFWREFSLLLRICIECGLPDN